MSGGDYTFRKTEITEDERAEEDAFSRLDWEEQLEQKRTRIKTYKLGDAVKAVLGGYRGPYVYGYVTRVGELHVEFQEIGTTPKSGVIVASPGLCSGLAHVSTKEMTAAKDHFVNKKT